MTNLPAPPYSYETAKTASSVNWKSGVGNGRKVTGITIHHWGASKGLDFDGIVNFLCSPRPNNPTSAHYVAQGKDAKGNVKPRVSCIVDPDDIAYACGNWNGNLSTVSIECRPECWAEDREVVAQLIARIWNVYGIVPIYPHSHWTATECCGDNWRANLVWLKNRATEILKGVAVKPSTNPTPTKETIMNAADVWNADIVKAPAGTDLKTNPNWTPASYLYWMMDKINKNGEAIAALNAKVDKLLAK